MTRLRDDRGMALVIAVGVMLVLSITVTSVISYTSAGSRSTNVSAAGQKATALAEAGLNNALSVLSKSGSDSGAINPPPAYAGDPNSTVTSYVGGGTATWGATWGSATRTWTIKSIGSVPNPTGPGAAPVTRTIYGAAVIPAPPYSFVSLDSLCEKHTLTVRSSGVLTVTNAMYTNSCDMGHDAFDIFGPGGSINAPDIRVVGGWETHDGDPVVVDGITCPYLNANPPALGTPGTPTPGCPSVGQPVLADPFVNVAAPALSATPACTKTLYGTAASYTSDSTKPKTSVGIDGVTTTVSITNPSWVADGDVIQIESEWMLVVSGGGSGVLQVERGFYGTIAKSHGGGKELKKVPISTGGTAAIPGQCEVPYGTVTLQPGTYYGGICIGAPAGSNCSAGSCAPNDPYNAAAYSPAEKFDLALAATDTSTVANGATPIEVGDYVKIEDEWLHITGVTVVGTTSTLTFTRGELGSTAVAHGAGKSVLKGTPAISASVTMAPGTYIMAGGGFHICGASSLSAPNVLIYNTQDPTNNTGAGALDGVLINTNGDVALGPQTAGTYAGLTIFQDRNLALLPASNCDGRAGHPEKFDIGMLSAASTGANGKLGSISGTLYTPALHSIFVSTVSGRANLAVMASCILIDGGDAIYDFKPSGLFGVGLQLARQWG